MKYIKYITRKNNILWKKIYIDILNMFRIFFSLFVLFIVFLFFNSKSLISLFLFLFSIIILLLYLFICLLFPFSLLCCFDSSFSFKLLEANSPLSSFFLIIENLEPNLLFIELFEFLPLKKPAVLFIKVFLLWTSLVLKEAIIFNSSVLL